MSFDGSRRGRNEAMDALRSGDALLAVPVRLHGIQVGQAVDLVLDTDGRRAVGFDVRCGDDVRRFLPFAAGRVGEDEIALGSALLLLEGGNLAFYRNRTRSLRSLRGSRVTRGATPLGTLRDVMLKTDGTVAELVLDAPSGVRRVPAGANVKLGDDGAASAA